jgi:hypothetical protein
VHFAGDRQKRSLFEIAGPHGGAGGSVLASASLKRPAWSVKPFIFLRPPIAIANRAFETRNVDIIVLNNISYYILLRQHLRTSPILKARTVLWMRDTTRILGDFCKGCPFEEDPPEPSSNGSASK